MICVHLDQIREWARRISGLWSVHLLGIGALVFALALLDARWLAGQSARDSARVLQATAVIAGAGAAVLVLVVITWSPAGLLLKTRPIQWLGRISFSLYLTHLPVVWTVAHLQHRQSWEAQGLIAIPLSLAIAELFTRLVEHPAHRLSQIIRRTHADHDGEVDRQTQPELAGIGPVGELK
jgi:peptidoglycan/LPS O-acetylase OafA/YrhL